MIQTYQSGFIPASGVVSVNVGGWTAPFTAGLMSSAVNRQIAASSNPTATPEAVTPDIAATAWINFAFMAPVGLVRFTGAPGDAWEIR